MEGRTDDDTKAAILQIARFEFATKGYEAVTLEQIAGEVGIPPAAVSGYFANKAELLEETMTPFEAALDGVISNYARSDPPLSPADRTQLVTSLVETYCRNRLVVLVLLRDVSSNWPVHINPRHTNRLARLAMLLAGDHPTTEHQVVVDAILGVITRPLLDPAIDTDDDRTRRLIIAMAVDIAKRLGNEASRSWADGRRATDVHPGLVSP